MPRLQGAPVQGQTSWVRWIHDRLPHEICPSPQRLMLRVCAYKKIMIVSRNGVARFEKMLFCQELNTLQSGTGLFWMRVEHAVRFFYIHLDSRESLSQRIVNFPRQACSFAHGCQHFGTECVATQLLLRRR